MKKKIKLLFMILLIFMILIVCYSRYIEPERLVVKEITVETEMDIEECRIVFFTDTHSGHTHGGQVSVPYFTKKRLPNGSDQFIKGFLTRRISKQMSLPKCMSAAVLA